MPHPQKIRSLARLVSRSPLRSRRSRSLSRSSERNRSRIRDSANASNTENILFVGGLSKRATSEDLIRHFTSPGMPGKVLECEVVRHPQYKESRGFAFVTMETINDADFCVRYLNQTDLFGRLMTVEKAERSRRWSPTPGRYESLKNNRGHDSRQSRSYSPRGWHEDDSYSRRGRSQTRSPYGRGDYSPRAWDEKADSYSRRRRSRSGSPYGRRDKFLAS